MMTLCRVAFRALTPLFYGHINPYGLFELDLEDPEVGKGEKTIFLCDYLSSRETQYEVNDGLQVVENWNSTNEFICYGRHPARAL